MEPLAAMTTSRTTRDSKSGRGFTLIELCVVLVLIAIALAIAIPRYGGFMTRGTLRSETRRLASAARYLSHEASRTGKTHYLNFDPRRGRYWVTIDTGAARAVEERTQLAGSYTLPDGVRIADMLVVERGLRKHGRHQIGFYPRGESDEAIVRFSNMNKSRFYSLHIKPYGRYEVYDYYYKGK